MRHLHGTQSAQKPTLYHLGMPEAHPSESDLLSHIYAHAKGLKASGGWSVEVGPGDDCAVLKGSNGEPLLITVDQLVEGVHFTPGTPIDLIARKAVARSVSDIAAMGGTPSWATATGLLPKDYPHGKELIDALNVWAAHWGCPLIGGDLAFHAEANHPLTLTVTVAGVMSEGHQPVLRSGASDGGASQGDRVYLTGSVGGSFERGSGLGRHLIFEPRLEAGQWASKVNSTGHPNASSMIDLSDGLGRDAGRIAEASAVTIEMEAQKIPLGENVKSAGWRAAIADGEDYELLILIPEGTTIPAELGLIGPIGRCCGLSKGQSHSVVVIEADRTRHDAAALGWDHGTNQEQA